MQNSKKIIALATAGVITLCSTSALLKQVVLKKDSPYDNTTSINIENTSNNMSDNFSDIVDNVTFKEEDTSLDLSNTKETIETTVYTRENDNTDYNTIVIKLNKIMEQKGFDSKVKLAIQQNLKRLYKNYNSYYEIYKCKGVPNFSEFVEKNFLQDLECVKSINLVTGNQYGREFLDKYNANGLCYPDGTIYMNYFDDLENEDSFQEDLFEEITHAGQNFSAPKSLKEGEASFFKAMSSDSYYYSYLETYKNVDGTSYSIKSAAPSNYAFYCKCYNNLLCMTNYDVMQQYVKDANLDNVINYISKKYNVDCKIIVTNFVNIDSEKNEALVCKKTKDFENLMIHCFEQDIQNISSKEEAIDYLKLYRHYKNQYQTRVVIEKDSNSFKDCTEEKFDFSNIDKKLYEKVCEYDAINRISDDEATNYAAFCAIVSIHNSLDDFFMYDENLDLDSTKYYLNDNDDTLYLKKGEFVTKYNLSNNTTERNIEASKFNNIDFTSLVSSNEKIKEK